MPCSPATAATETPGVRQVAKSVALNSGEYLRWVRRVEYLWFSEVLSIVSTIKFVDTILQDLAANLKMTLLDAYASASVTWLDVPLGRSRHAAHLRAERRPSLNRTWRPDRACFHQHALFCACFHRHALNPSGFYFSPIDMLMVLVKGLVK